MVYNEIKCKEFSQKLTFSRYSDIVLEARPITSGRSLILVYKLIHTGTGRPRSAAGQAGDNPQLKSVISRWKSLLPYGPESLAYVFRGNYVDKDLSIDALKGRDAKVAMHLKKACEELDFYFCLANVQLEVKGE